MRSLPSSPFFRETSSEKLLLGIEAEVMREKTMRQSIPEMSLHVSDRMERSEFWWPSATPQSHRVALVTLQYRRNASASV